MTNKTSNRITAVASAIAIGGAGYLIAHNDDADDDYVETAIVTSAPVSSSSNYNYNYDDEELTIENADYIGNANSKKFHHSWCDSVDDMNEYNKVPFETASEALENGYKSCKRCNP